MSCLQNAPIIFHDNAWFDELEHAFVHSIKESIQGFIVS
jgi:hypothetical protein